MLNRFYGKKTAVLMIFIFVLSVSTSCNVSVRKRVRNRNSTTKAETAKEVQTHKMTGVVTNTDLDLQQVTIRELDSDVDTILDYNAVSGITDKYGEDITGDDLEPGQIMEVVYDTEKSSVITMSVPDNVWEYKNVDKFSFDGDENALSVAGRKYQYTDWTYFSDLDRTIQMMELNSRDIVTIRGIGITVYSVTRTAGHGYIRLANYAPFLGGMVSVGNNIILTVTENMLLTAGVGQHRVMLSNGKVNAVKNVTVKDGEEITLDFSEYKEEVKNIGNITFTIEPYGADLYINGTNIDYSSPVALNYGEYKIEVELTGYTSYTGILDVEKPESEVKIDLIDEDASVDGVSSTDGTPKPSQPSHTPQPSSGAADDVTKKKIDSSHTITVQAPEGAEVYLDNVYKGLAPCTFTKIIGSQTVTLSRSGYLTKSYSVDILDDGKDVKLGFSELVKSSG
ncbi:MAG TPA: hypothetical protein DCZ23_01715 [Lachnospiraceae bacterium]|nr:hypothetical protein [Lachnospiraceae bacterium]